MNEAFKSLNMNLRGIGQSATLAINERSKALRREGRKIYGMGLGQSPFPIPQSVVDSLKMHAHEKDYLHVQGLPALRTAVAEFH
ncbi:MAG TPA: aspartate aminotransferase, partial [Bacteroidetes bacterium]|nr:aspartate aminotransferase [Bacteroidota bacterium]